LLSSSQAASASRRKKPFGSSASSAASSGSLSALEAGGKPASKVHPYNGTFGKMLDSQRRAESAAPAK
jgi:hypothetical protein